jgi:hypothetical protein
LAFKKKENLIHATTWVKPEDIVLTKEANTKTNIAELQLHKFIETEGRMVAGEGMRS